MSAVQPALGTKLGFATIAAPTVFIDIGGLVNIKGPDTSLGEADTTNLGSTVKTCRPTLIDPGSLTASMQWDPSDTVAHQLLLAAFLAKEIHQWQLDFTTSGVGGLWTFPGFIKKFPPDAGGPEENLMIEFEVRVTGVFVPAAS